MEQLDMFNEAYEKGKKELKPVDYTSQIGVYHEIAHIKGIQEMSEKGLQLLHYLYVNHARPEDEFIHAKHLAYLLNWNDTRDIRLYASEIDYKTDLVVFSSQDGYKLASSEKDIIEAVKFAIAPALTILKRSIAKNKVADDKWLQGYIGNKMKEKDVAIQGQQQIDIDLLDIIEVNHYADSDFKEYQKSVQQMVDEE
jgi:hypothetical protein